MTTTPEVSAARCAGHWGKVRCPNEATRTLTYECACGHVAADNACGECRARSLRLISGGNFICTECEDGPEPHACPVAAREDQP